MEFAKALKINTTRKNGYLESENWIITWCVGHLVTMSYPEKYNEEKYFPIDGRLVRIADHLSALMEADISIKHGITSIHLQNGRDGLLNSYDQNEIINGIDVYSLFNEIVS